MTIEIGITAKIYKSRNLQTIAAGLNEWITDCLYAVGVTVKKIIAITC